MNQTNHSPSNRLTDLSALAIDGLPDHWQAILSKPPASTQLARTVAAIKAELAAKATIYPKDPWRALRLTDLNDAKVVILGQDPYHGPDQAQGLAFSVGSHCKAPPSLRNIFAEISQDPLLQTDSLRPMPDPDLSRWAEQGVLLLNTSLTVRDGQAASHAKLGWQVITDAIISAVAKRQTPTVFMLWGAHAQAKTELIQTHGRQHLILSANHPSPLSARRPPVPFLGCGHFGRANEWLEGRGLRAVRW
ncbi:MAG: uracil-DNA glycosylase [Burkholderiaceae bacterium]|nr:uracil-DNA glycosylase [Burkholderiaceae bacterium]MCD8517136.1 uracil-DNA glycosylase [Burkholderiaceae bacterium]MCD8536561.1 uracil-DNA glycosylase [Burkholderiaceae bacterium]MCD8565318.1 uracil-DNA glycosylase [Burkholderiaceae bacterium]